ncbi:hypothetical protein [Nonomuraea sp. NPDC050202]|uniref:hypothetical protein n=1 Tax=Nonomuraea sp. NPDC050202 TaxID=3155035 RepID=UPI00340B0501
MMGGCLEPTPQMGPFAVEVRRESFYLGCHRDHLAIAPDREWSIPLDQVPALFAAFAQVRAHPSYNAALPGAGDTPWYQVERREGRVHVLGLGHAYLGDTSTRDWPYKTVEVKYRHMQLLQDEITHITAGTSA